MNARIPFVSVIRRTRSRRGRSLAIGTVLLLATAFLLRFVNDFYPIGEWLFFSYLLVWTYVAGFFCVCLTAGWWLLRQVVPVAPRLPERVVLALTLGVLLFYIVMFLTGILGLYSPATFFTVPLLLLALGIPRTARDLPRFLSRSKVLRPSSLVPRTWLTVVTALVCVTCIAGIYLQVLLPRNVHADSHWYHLPIAEHYIAAGGIVRFAEGWYVGCYPQLASLLYTWAFLAPGDLFTHVLLSAHLDFALFIAMVFGVSVLAARLLGLRRFPFAGTAVFLFPGVFLYDSNVNASADHILAFWVPAVGITLLRLARNFTTKEALLAGLAMSGAVCTKYQASYLVVPAVVLVSLLVIRRRSVVPGLVWLATVGIVSASHWLKNLVYYHDPLYPLLNNYLPSTPFHDGAAALISRIYWLPRFAAKGAWPDRLWDATKALGTFSFIHNDWDFHGPRPVFGFLFTLLIPALPLLRAPLRLWMLVVGTHLGLTVWHVTSHQDRFLQALLPWMAAATAAALALAWQRGVAARIGATALVMAQLIWGLDVYFIKSHNMIGDSPFRATGDYLSAGYRGDYAGRRIISDTNEKVAAILTPNTTLLLHTHMARLGLGVKVVADGIGWQGAIEYLDHTTPITTATLWRQFGIDHVMRYVDSGGLDPSDTARELVFHRWLAQYAGTERRIDGARVAHLTMTPTEPSLAEDATRIAWLDCTGKPPLGLYLPRDLIRHLPTRVLSKEQLQNQPATELGDATAIAQHGNCPNSTELEHVMSTQFSQRAMVGSVSLWVRTQRSPARS